MEKNIRKEIPKKIIITILISMQVPIISMMVINFVNNNKINNYSKINLDFRDIDQNLALSRGVDDHVFSAFSEYNILENHKFNLIGENVYNIDDVFIDHGKRVAFLTFDDGPSANTETILNILNEKKVKATFFILGVSAVQDPSLVLKIAQQGHGIGNHSYSHNVYYGGNFTPDVFLLDILKNLNALKGILGETFQGNLVRFPGGNFYETYNKMIPYNTMLIEAGFKDIDWNVDSMDSSSFSPSKEFILQNIKNQCENKKTAVILMHDLSYKQGTVEALPEIIDYLVTTGFEFAILNPYQ